MDRAEVRSLVLRLSQRRGSAPFPQLFPSQLRLRPPLHLVSTSSASPWPWGGRLEICSSCGCPENKPSAADLGISQAFGGLRLGTGGAQFSDTIAALLTPRASDVATRYLLNKSEWAACLRPPCCPLASLILSPRKTTP